MNSQGYVDILQNNLLRHGCKIAGRSWIFQQDNASINASRHTNQWFSEKKVNVLLWPSKSSDLNPIEKFWGILVRRVYANGRQFQSKQELKDAIKLEWDKITVGELKNLITSMPNRVFEVVQRNGEATKY